MTISFGSIGAKSAGSTTANVSVAYPTGITSGHVCVIDAVGWESGAGLNALTGWTFQGQTGGGTGSAADSHTTTVGLFSRVLDGSESGSVTVSRGGTISGHLGIMARYSATNGFDTANFESVGGTDNTHGADRSVTASANMTLQPGDVIVIGVAVDTDAALTITSPAISASGITFGTITRQTSGAGVTSGNDGNVELFDVEVTSGSGNVAVTFSFTTSTSQCGPCRFLKLRELAATPAPVIRRTQMGALLQL